MVVLYACSVPQLDELDGRGAARQLAVLRPDGRARHLPALRHHQAGHRQLEEGAFYTLFLPLMTVF